MANLPQGHNGRPETVGAAAQDSLYYEWFSFHYKDNDFDKAREYA